MPHNSYRPDPFRQKLYRRGPAQIYEDIDLPEIGAPPMAEPYESLSINQLEAAIEGLGAGNPLKVALRRNLPTPDPAPAATGWLSSGLYGDRERLTAELAPRPSPVNPFSSLSLSGVEGEGLPQEPSPSKLWWEWSGGGNEPRPEEGQQWLQRAGAGTPFPQPLSNAELSEASYQFPNAPHIQEAWGVRKAEDLAAATRTQQALNALREAETETSPLVSGLRERQARQKAYPSQEQALGMIGQAEIAGRYGEERANITAQALLQRAMLTAISQGDLASARRYQSLITARARIASLPQDDDSREALAFIDAQIMNEMGPQLFSGGEDMGDYDDALEGLLESFR